MGDNYRGEGFWARAHEVGEGGRRQGGALSRPWFRALERFDRRACCRRLSFFKTVTCFSPDHKNLAFEYQEVSPSVVFLPYKCVLVFLMQLGLSPFLPEEATSTDIERSSATA